MKKLWSVGSDKLYTGSRDETMRVWDCQSGQFCYLSRSFGLVAVCRVIKVGGEMGRMLSEVPCIFVGLPNLVKAWNVQISAELSLNGPVGQVYSLVVGNDLLFVGTQMAGDSSKDLERSYFDVLGLCCSSEVQLIDMILKPLEGVHHVSVIVPTRTVIVLHDVAHFAASNRGVWSATFVVIFKYVYSPFQWLALGVVVVDIIPLVLKAIASLRNLEFDINILMLIAAGGSVFLKDYWEAGMIVFLLNISKWLEKRASHMASAVMSSLLSIAPQTVVLANTGEEVNTKEVMVNTRLSVKAGTMIPIDGVVVDGNSEVEEKALIGESFPVSKQVDSNVSVGTVNLNGYITIKTTTLAEACVKAKMVKLAEEAQSNKS
ncbi:putative translocase transcription factor WD40-like family [Helianthus anomalus]